MCLKIYKPTADEMRRPIFMLSFILGSVIITKFIQSQYLKSDFKFITCLIYTSWGKTCRELSRFFLFKGLLSRSNGCDMSILQLISPVCPWRAAIASGHFPFTLGIIWKEKKTDATSHSASLQLSKNNWQQPLPWKEPMKDIVLERTSYNWRFSFKTPNVQTYTKLPS